MRDAVPEMYLNHGFRVLAKFDFSKIILRFRRFRERLGKSSFRPVASPQNSDWCPQKIWRPHALI